jgi:hypothetical protein
MDDAIMYDNLLLMKFVELMLAEVVKQGLTDEQAEQAAYDAWTRLGAEYGDSDSETVQNNTTSCCENVYYI